MDVVHRIKKRTTIHAINIIISHLVRSDIALVINKIIGKLLHVIQIFSSVCKLISLKHGFSHESLRIVPLRLLHTIRHPKQRIVLHLRFGQTYDPIVVILSLMHPFGAHYRRRKEQDADKR